MQRYRRCKSLCEFPNQTVQPTQSSKFNIFLRRDSKGLIDEYFTKKQERRRSSCKEVTLKLINESLDNFGQPRFTTIETSRRCSLPSQPSIEKVEEHPDKNDQEVNRASMNYFPAPDPIIRPTSAEGYNSEESRERREDMQVLLFDSTPDLSSEGIKVRFPSVRSHRRNAVCFDTNLPLLELSELNLDD